MAGSLFYKERTLVTLTSTGTSITTGSAAAVGTDLDCRAAGNAADDLEAWFELTCQFATITGIIGGVTIADLYLVPKLDGTNAADVDLTASTSRAPLGAYFDSFVCAKAPTAATNMRFVTGKGQLFPLLFTPYLINRAGQTMTVNWTLKVVSAQMQYS